MTFIYERLYREAADLANELSQEVGYYCSKKIEQVKCYDIERYVQEVENVEFMEYEFKNNLNKLMLGSVNKIQDEILITTNKNLMLERKNFTKMHEIIHFYRDVLYLVSLMHFLILL
ncbi:MAG: toxin [Enterococcus durans]